MTLRVRYQFRGRIAPRSFRDFAVHRAARLSLEMAVESVGTTEARIVVAGPPDLLDAFEMALSLGPCDCLVRSVERATL